MNIGISRATALGWIVAGATLAGCASAPFSKFEPAAAVTTTPAVQQLVVSVVEARPSGGRDSLGAGFLAWIPLVPYGHQEFNSGGPDQNLIGDLGPTVRRDLLASGLVADVFSGTLDAARRVPGYGTSHVLKLTLHDGVWHRYFTLYGISLAGFFVWLIGLPASYGDCVVDFTAELSTPDGRILGSQRFAASEGYTEWVYTAFGSADGFSAAYASISPKLRTFVADTVKGGGAP